MLLSHPVRHFESTAFLSGADKNKYGHTFDDLENDQMRIVDSFPKTVIIPTISYPDGRTICTDILILICPMME
jgi:hypothetical protein